MGQVAKQAATTLMSSAGKAGGITSKIASGASKVADKVKDAIDAYRNMNRASKIVVTAAMYLGAVGGGAVVAQLFFPELFDNWAAAMFGTAFMIMAVKGTSDDFAQGFQKALPGLAKKMGRTVGKNVAQLGNNPSLIQKISHLLCKNPCGIIDSFDSAEVVFKNKKIARMTGLALDPEMKALLDIRGGW